ncbi:MAG: molybdopterin-dependent oxidoreductase [Solirubrobacteraceae bacterium]
MDDSNRRSRSEQQTPRENIGARRVGRAGFLGLVGAGAATLVFGDQISHLTSDVTKPFASATGLSGIVPSGGWRIYTVAPTMPTFDPVTWRLRIDGLVERPVELSHAGLRAMPKTEQVSTFHCVTGWTVTGVHWGGVRLTDLVALARPLPGAHAARFISAEVPYDEYLTLDQAALHDVLLAYEMDGAPLPREHGAPARLVIPEMYGYKSAKWIRQITLVAKPGAGYWEQRGYDQDAWVGHSNGYD